MRAGGDRGERAAALQTALEDLLHQVRLCEWEWRLDDRIQLAIQLATQADRRGRARRARRNPEGG